MLTSRCSETLRNWKDVCRCHLQIFFDLRQFTKPTLTCMWVFAGVSWSSQQIYNTVPQITSQIFIQGGWCGTGRWWSRTLSYGLPWSDRLEFSCFSWWSGHCSSSLSPPTFLTRPKWQFPSHTLTVNMLPGTAENLKKYTWVGLQRGGVLSRADEI